VQSALTSETHGMNGNVASAQRVENRVPDGATWDGKTDLPLDEKTYQEMLSERDPSQPASASPQKSGT